jgi:DHA2 family multidrug resistance protein
MLSFLRTTAGAFAVSLTTTSWSNATIKSRVGLAGRVNGQATLDQMQQAGLSQGQALTSLDQITQQQAVMTATNNVFVVLAVLATISAFSIWLAPKPEGPVTMGGGGH